MHARVIDGELVILLVSTEDYLISTKSETVRCKAVDHLKNNFLSILKREVKLIIQNIGSHNLPHALLLTKLHSSCLSLPVTLTTSNILPPKLLFARIVRYWMRFLMLYHAVLQICIVLTLNMGNSSLTMELFCIAQSVVALMCHIQWLDLEIL